MYARKLAIDISDRPGEMSNDAFDELPRAPGSSNARAREAFDALTRSSRATTRACEEVLRATSRALTKEDVARRRQGRLCPWTRWALEEGGNERGERASERATTTTTSDDGDGARTLRAVNDVDVARERRREELIAIARSAMASAREATRLRAEERERFTERRKFAGKMIDVEQEYVEGSKEAKAHDKRAEALARGGIDAVLAELMGPKKLNVLDKTKADWRGVKDVDAELDEDLLAHQRGGKTFREQQDFLQQADYREYELERDARLAAASKRAAR